MTKTMRRFEYQDTKSRKFWEIDRQGSQVTVRWGRIGTGGQTRIKDLGTEAKAIAEVDKQIGSKTAKGYQEAGAATAPAATPAATPTATPASPPSPAMAIAALSAAASAAAAAGTSSASTPSARAAAGATGATNDLADGEEATVPGSGSRTYTLRNVGGVYSCTCPAWRNQSAPIDRRTCKHLRRFRGDAAETTRLGSLPAHSATTRRSSGGGRTSTSGSGTVTAPPVLLAHRWEDQDPTGWLMSEKLDGVRAYWDGKGFVSRLGNPYFAPDWFRHGLPAIPLDGELFAGRGRFQTAVSIARRADGGKAWKDLSYVIFDAPEVPGGFEQRLIHIEQHFAATPHPYARVLEHRPCTGVTDLRAELARIEALAGEGVMIRKPGSLYVAGRSDTLLKVKSFLDREAKVVGHQPGSGRHKGRLGALLVELPDGTPFKVGTGLSDAERESPPKLGAIITVRYQELTNAGVPRFPVYVGVRVDVDWDKLVAAAQRSG